MSWKRSLLESAVWLAGRGLPKSRPRSKQPDSIFVLRNNDIGDLLVITPLFEALRRRFPNSRIVTGVGSWNIPVLQGNPHIDLVLPINAPWHNKFIVPQGLFPAFNYILSSKEIRALTRQRFAVGIDVLGSPFGSLLMLRSRIPYRLGVKGYAGGHSATQRYLDFNPTEHVGQTALSFAKLLGATELPDTKPQVFLDPNEINWAEHSWRACLHRNPKPPLRILIGPGGGFAEKCWPLPSWIDLVQRLALHQNLVMIITGGAQDNPAGARLAAINPRIQNLAGSTTLRKALALTAQADLVLCHSSMLMHAAAAFSKPALILLGDHFPSAQAHARQWGHGPGSHLLGKDSSHPTIYSAEEVYRLLNARFLEASLAA